MAAGICGKTRKQFTGIGFKNGSVKYKSIIDQEAKFNALQNAFDQAGQWIDSVSCSKRCAAKSQNTGYVSISVNGYISGNVYIATSFAEIFAEVECKDINKIPVKNWVVR